MNRKNYIVHLSLALMVILVAAFVGQVRRWNAKHSVSETRGVFRQIEYPPHEEAVRETRAKAGEPEVLIRFRSGVSAARINALISERNDQVEDKIESVNGLVAVDDLDGVTAAMVAQQYAELPEVEYVEENYDRWGDVQVSERSDEADPESPADAPAGGPNDPLFGEQWSLNNDGRRDGKAQADVGALSAWLKTHGNSKVVVAVLDSGVDYSHQDLAENIWTRPASLAPYFDEHLGEIDDYHGFDAVNAEGLPDPMDENGHGTHCAGIIGAVGDNGEGIAGVNWKVEIMPLRFMSPGGFGTTKDAIEAINYVIERKRAGVNVRIISASWGSTRRSRALEDVIRKAGEEGILFIAAAGNSSVNTDRTPHYPSGYKLPNVMSVAALDRRDQLAGFSNYGPKSVHVAAPGKEILSTWLRGNYEEHSGTSMATPVVSGIAALVLSCEPELKVEQLKQRLMDSVDKLDALNGKTISGGRINAARAVGAVK